MLGKVNQFSSRFRQKKNDVFFHVPVPDYIPYACHYDADTLLTKSGELMQIVKVTGFSGEVVGANRQELRSVIRKAMREHINTDEFALWFHTVRRRRSLSPEGSFVDEFSYQLNQSWKERHSWDEKYINEVYISIIHCGVSASVKNVKGLFQALLYQRLKKVHQSQLQEASISLKKVVDNILTTLQQFGAKRLTLYEEQGKFYSEQLEFFGKILNLVEVPMEMPVEDLSTYLASHQIAFGFNILEVKSETAKRVAALFTIKDYREMPTWALDEFLQLPQEFIITQTMDYINNREAIKQFKQQDYIYKVSDDKRLSAVSGVEAIIKSGKGALTDFGRSQLTVLVIADTVKDLQEQIGRFIYRTSALGLLMTRRDLRLEECFWAQLPANFSYISRRNPISTAWIGGLASLYNFPAGKSKGNYWGAAATIFYTVDNTPYFFNFHVGSCGHTAILGPHSSGKTALLNFLVAQAQKYHGKLFCFDYRSASKVFINAIKGHYAAIVPTVPSADYAFNPFNILLIDDGSLNRQYLVYWLTLLVYAQGKEVKEAYRAVFQQVVDYVVTLPVEERMLRNVVKYLESQHQMELASLLEPWHSNGKYACLFDNKRNDVVPLRGMIYGFDMEKVIEDKITLGPVLSYLLHRVEMALDGTPTIIVLDEAWKLVNNPIFSPYLAQWLDRMQEKNAIVIFATESVNNASKSEITPTIVGKISTQIFMPNSKAAESSNAYKTIWGLSEKEFDMLTSMQKEKRQFMLKQQKDSVVCVLDLAGMKELAVLSGSNTSAEAMEKAIEKKGSNPEDWLAEFYQLAQEEYKKKPQLI